MKCEFSVIVELGEDANAATPVNWMVDECFDPQEFSEEVKGFLEGQVAGVKQATVQLKECC